MKLAAHHQYTVWLSGPYYLYIYVRGGALSWTIKLHIRKYDATTLDVF